MQVRGNFSRNNFGCCSENAGSDGCVFCKNATVYFDALVSFFWIFSPFLFLSAVISVKTLEYDTGLFFSPIFEEN